MFSLYQAVIILLAPSSPSHNPLALQFRFTNQIVYTPKAQEIEDCEDICACDTVGTLFRITLIRPEFRPGERW
jgi:hypothetical protein